MLSKIVPCKLQSVNIFSILAIISIPPSVYSAIIVGTTIHLVAEGMRERKKRFHRFQEMMIFFFLDRTGFPIGQRSFTSPASVMQPFKAQLSEQAMLNSSRKLS